MAGVDAASGTFLRGDTALLLICHGKTIRLANMASARLSSAHPVFANGSTLRVGDTTATNTLDGTGQGGYLLGLEGDDILYGGAGGR